MPDTYECEVISGNPNPSLADLNKKAIAKLYELMDGLDAKSDPDLVRAFIESLSKLNTSLRNNDVLPQAETEEERTTREQSAVLADLLKGE